MTSLRKKIIAIGGALAYPTISLSPDITRENFCGKWILVTGASHGIGRAYERFRGIVRSWSELIALLEKVAEEEDRRDILEASERLKELSEREREAMQLLLAGD